MPYMLYCFQYLVPNDSTTYICTGFQMPDIGGKHHMIKVKKTYGSRNEQTRLSLCCLPM